MVLSTLAKRGGLFLLLGTLLVYFVGLGAAPLVGPDEPRYAQVAREMFLRGDPVTPTLASHNWFEKPALLYWLMMANYSLFGVTEYAVRLGSALAGALTILFVGWVAGRAERETGERLRSFGLVAAAVMASTLGLVVFSRAASFDVLLTVTITAALSCFLVGELERGGRGRPWLLAGLYAGMGASLLAKGLVGVILPAGVLCTYFLMRREFPKPFRSSILWGGLICACVAATWYAPVILRHGWEFVDEFFLQHHFQRYVSNKYKHPQPFYFYLPVMALLALPWTPFLVTGLAGLRRLSWRAESAEAKLRLLAFAWSTVPVVFFSFSGSKLPGYVLPAIPGAALLAGERVTKYLRGSGGLGAMRATGLLALALFVAGGTYAFRESTNGKGAVLSLSCVVAVLAPAGLSGLLATLLPGRRQLCFTAIVAATFLTVLLIVGCALGVGAREHSTRGLFEVAQAEGYGNLPVFQLHVVERTAEFYAAGRLAYDAEGQPLKYEGAYQVIDAMRLKGGSALVLVPPELQRQLTAVEEVEARVLGDNGQVALVHLRLKE